MGPRHEIDKALPVSWPHMTVSVVPGVTLAIGLVLSPGMFKLILLKIEVGVCWENHLDIGL